MSVSTYSPDGVRKTFSVGACGDSAASYKRCVFGTVSHCLIPLDKRGRHEGDNLDDAAAKASRFF